MDEWGTIGTVEMTRVRIGRGATFGHVWSYEVFVFAAVSVRSSCRNKHDFSHLDPIFKLGIWRSSPVPPFSSSSTNIFVIVLGDSARERAFGFSDVLKVPKTNRKTENLKVSEDNERTMNVPIVSGDILLDDEGYRPRFVRVSQQEYPQQFRSFPWVFFNRLIS